MSEVFAMPLRRAATVNCSKVGGDRLFTRPRWIGDIRAGFLQERTSGVKRGAGSARKWVAKHTQERDPGLKSGNIRGMWKTFSSRGLAPALGLCLAVTGSPALGAEHTFNGVYSGNRVLTKGSASSMCPAEDDVSVTIHGETLTFTDSALQKFTEPFFPVQTDHSARLILVK